MKHMEGNDSKIFKEIMASRELSWRWDWTTSCNIITQPQGVCKGVEEIVMNK